MNYKRALITGGAGLIGSHIADLLVAEGLDEVVVLDNFTRGRYENLEAAATAGNITIVEGDVRDTDLLREIMEGVDLVFHQAAIRITECAEKPRLALDVLATGTFNLLEVAAAARVKKVIAASSASIYGLAEKFPTPETHHGYDNRTIYGASKLFSEGLLRTFYEMYGLDYLALRPFNVYGPRMDAVGAYTEVMIRWMERLANGKPCLILGDGRQTMDFVYVGDVARAYILAAKSTLTDQVFNIASGTETSLNELAETLGRVMGVPRAPEYGPARKVNHIPRRLADVSKAKRLLGFNAQISLEEGLRRLVAWWTKEQKRQFSAAGSL